MGLALTLSMLSGVAIVLAVVAIVSWAGRRRMRAEIAALRERLDAQQVSPTTHTSAPPAVPAVAGREYLITTAGVSTGSTGGAGVSRGGAIGARAFASVAMGESLVRVVSFGYGVARALSPESRNRIRFAIGREVKRARKQRRREQKAAWRAWVSTDGVSTGSTDGAASTGSTTGARRTAA